MKEIPELIGDFVNFNFYGFDIWFLADATQKSHRNENWSFYTPTVHGKSFWLDFENK